MELGALSATRLARLTRSLIYFFGTLGFRYILMSAWDVQPKGADMIWDDDMYARVRHDMLLTLSEVKKP